MKKWIIILSIVLVALVVFYIIYKRQDTAVQDAANETARLAMDAKMSDQVTIPSTVADSSALINDSIIADL